MKDNRSRGYNACFTATHRTVSCIIPARDRKDMVLKAIERALAQEGWVPEVVVSDERRHGDPEGLGANYGSLANKRQGLAGGF